jgi:cell division inhibitor SepF
MPQVIDALRQQKSVILNMTLIRQEEAQRSVDFVAGGTYAMDGHYERIGDNIFLFTGKQP